MGRMEMMVSKMVREKAIIVTANPKTVRMVQEGRTEVEIKMAKRIMTAMDKVVTKNKMLNCLEYTNDNSNLGRL